MKKITFLFSFLMIAVIYQSCIQPPTYAFEPEIAYLGINKNTISQGAVPDTLIVNFSFTDGDGDLSSQDSLDVFFIDSRQGAITNFKLPPIAEEGTANGISGEIQISITNSIGNICCLYDNGDDPCTSRPGLVDTFSFAIQIRDRASNYSNIINTEPIYILCD